MSLSKGTEKEVKRAVKSRLDEHFRIFIQGVALRLSEAEVVINIAFKKTRPLDFLIAVNHFPFIFRKMTWERASLWSRTAF